MIIKVRDVSVGDAKKYCFTNSSERKLNH